MKKSARQGLTLMEESFCQLCALGRTAREAYSEAFSMAITDRRREHLVDNRAGRLMKRADVVARIEEAKGEAKRRNREKWERRGEDIADRLFVRIMERDGKGKMLAGTTLKGIEVLARLKGMNAPDETVLKDGGLADNFVPRGVQGMSAADLDAIIEQAKRTVDVEAEEVRG